MPKTDDGQYELVLENKQVLGIFFVAAILCGVFFALGFIVGKNTGGAYTPPAQKVGASAPAGEGKKSALAPAEPPPAATTPDTTPAEPVASKPAPPVESAQPAAELPPAPKPVTTQAASDPAITLQVAALSKKEDADAMVALLKKKNFPVTLVPGSSDKLYHVQVGPFSALKDAEATKARLENEGFKPMVKR